MLILKKKRVLRDVRVLLAILGISLIAGAAVFGQSATSDSEVCITRYVSTAYALPESQFLVTLRLETKHDLAGRPRDSPLWVEDPSGGECRRCVQTGGGSVGV